MCFGFSKRMPTAEDVNAFVFTKHDAAAYGAVHVMRQALIAELRKGRAELTELALRRALVTNGHTAAALHRMTRIIGPGFEEIHLDRRCILRLDEQPDMSLQATIYVTRKDA